MSKYIAPKANTYSLIEFHSKYGTEESCEQALFHLKWPNGFKCPNCGSGHYTVVGGRRLPLYQYPVCHKPLPLPGRSWQIQNCHWSNGSLLCILQPQTRTASLKLS